MDVKSFVMNCKCINGSLSRTLCMEPVCNMKPNEAILIVGEQESFISFLLCANSGYITDIPGSLTTTCE